MKKKLQPRLTVSSKLFALATIVVVGGFGSILVAASHAATVNHSPDGHADYCTVENGQTVLYGWAYDPDTTASAQPYVQVKVGGTALTIPTDRAGYRTSAINSTLASDYPGQPRGGVYGWRAQFGALYKGSSYSVSGTVFNYGSGSNVILQVNSTHHVDNDQSKPYFVGDKVPSACLVTKPTPPVSPAPAPSNPPKKVTTGSSSPSTTAPKRNTGSSASAPAPVSAAAGLPATTADAKVSVGTAGAKFQIPSDGAASLHIVYGSDGQLDSSSDEQTVSDSTTTVTLNSLNANTTYTYQIVRTNAGGTSNSDSASFTTKGYTISLKFLTNTNKGVSGLKGSLNDSHNTTATSNKSGTMKFSNLDDGNYTVTVNYHGQLHALDYSTDNVDTTDNPGKPAVLSDTINVSHFTSEPAPNSSGKSVAWLIVGIVFGLVLVAAGSIFFIRRKKARNTYKHVIGTTDIIDKKMHQHFQTHSPASGLPANGPPIHGNVSLRDMVIKSMHEQATKKPPRPPTSSSR